MKESKDNELVMITGGARSGKSSFGEKLAVESGRDVYFLATAHAGDPEMEKRIERHRRERPSYFHTRETPLDPGPDIKNIASPRTLILLDCFTVLLSNCLLREAGLDNSNAVPENIDDGLSLEKAADAVLGYVEQLVENFVSCPGKILVVSNELGMGVVPASPLGRIFRDLAGKSNQLLASRADQVWFVVSGIPQRIR